MTYANTLALVTVTYNSESVLEDFFDSLLKDPYHADLKVYMVDNASSDRTREIAEKYSSKIDVHVLENPENVGIAIANNQGVSAAINAGAEWILLINNDTTVPPATLAGLLETAQEEDLKILSPTIEGTDPAHSIWYAGGTISPYAGMKVRHSKFGSPVASAPKGLRQTPYASACCLLVHANVFTLIGGMDEDYFVYFDDVDFSIRARAAGITYWTTGEYTIVHKASSLTGGYLSPFSIRWISRNWVITARKHCTGIQKVTGFTYMQLWMFARVLARRDSFDQFKLRQRSFLEGLTAPIRNGGTVTNLTSYLHKVALNGIASNLERSSDARPHGD